MCPDGDDFEGVFLSLQRYAVLAQCSELIMNSVGSTASYHLGSGYYAKTSTNTSEVEICKYDYDTQIGVLMLNYQERITLEKSQFEAFISLIQEIENVIPELSILIPCYLQEDHQKPGGHLTCPECTPVNSYNSY